MFLKLEAAKQLAVFLNNKPGTLARLCSVLSEERVNIWAISTSDTIDHSVVRLVVDDPHRALRLLEERGTLVVDNEVLVIDGANKAGSLAAIADALSDGGVNIEYCYCATHPTSQRGLMILRPDNVPKALKILNTANGAATEKSAKAKPVKAKPAKRAAKAAK